jgi:DNA-binding LacI/PurR family transcriptional regulator
MAHKRSHVTIRTVAADAGVSTAAVSKVLRNAYGVSEALRSKVQRSVHKLGYRPRPAARMMRGRSYTMGILIPDIRNPFFADILEGVNTALDRTQYGTLVGISQSATAIEAAVIESMIDWQMDGVILIGARLSADDMARFAERIPLAAIAHHDPGATQFDTVNNDDRLGARLVVEHLLQTGRKHIAFLNLETPPLGEVTVTGQRLAGFRAALEERGIDPERRIVHAGQSSREIQLAARHLLLDHPPPDAIFCWTDFVAFEVLSVARQAGLKVPDDLAIVGYDNTRECDLAQNDLSSIDQSGQVLGLQAARLLVERINGREKAEHFLVVPRLVVRNSSQRRTDPKSRPA